MQSGVSEEPREAIFLNSLEGSSKFVDFQSPVFVFRFIP
jgi:DNA topoisomerase VI subunit B